MFRIRTSFSGCSSDTSISEKGGLSNTPEPVSCSSASSCQKTCRSGSAIGGRDITRSRAPLHSQLRDYHRSMARVATALLAPISVAAARIRRRPQRGLLAALGIAAATAMLAATIVGGRVSSELSVQRALAAVPIDQRAMRVLWSGAPAGGYRAVDPPATRALAQLAPGPAVRTVLYRETRFENSRIAVVTGVNDIGRWVTLTSGRLPRSCTPSRCEVVQVAGAPMPVAAAGPSRLVRVGTGRLGSALPVRVAHRPRRQRRPPHPAGHAGVGRREAGLAVARAGSDLPHVLLDAPYRPQPRAQLGYRLVAGTRGAGADRPQLGLQPVEHLGPRSGADRCH